MGGVLRPGQTPRQRDFRRRQRRPDRNEHDLTTDLEAEMLGYRHNHEIVKNPVGRIMELLPANAVIAFKVYQSLINKASNSDKGS